jgi:putative oxidoreductase
VRRLFSTFAHGAPGAGLLLLRLAVGTAGVDHAVTALITRPPFAAVAFYSSLSLMGVLLLVGLWTPIAGALVALTVVWEALSHSASWQHCVSTGIMAVALTLLGPGAWSVDAWLYGWKQIRISDRRQDKDETD